MPTTDSNADRSGDGLVATSLGSDDYAERPVVCVVASGAPPTAALTDLIGELRTAGWRPCVAMTSAAETFAVRSELEQATDLPVRVAHKRPNDPDLWPSAAAVIACPATFNTVNKLALGIADTFASSVLAEALGGGIPIIVVPCVNRSLGRHPAFASSLEALRGAGATILWDPSTYTSPAIVPWAMIVDALGPPPAAEHREAD